MALDLEFYKGAKRAWIESAVKEFLEAPREPLTSAVRNRTREGLIEGNTSWPELGWFFAVREWGNNSELLFDGERVSVFRKGAMP